MVSSSKSSSLLFFGIPFTLMGVMALIMFYSMPSPPMPGIALIFTIIPIAWICVGSILIILAINSSIKESNSYEEFSKIASESSRSEEWNDISTHIPGDEISDLKCPSCGAPLKSVPPCKCEYCGSLID